MTMNPNTNINDLQSQKGSLAAEQGGSRTAGSIAAAAFIAIVSFIVRRFYR